MFYKKLKKESIVKVFLIMLTLSFVFGNVNGAFNSLTPFKDRESGTQFKTTASGNYYAGIVFADWDSDGDLDMIKVEYASTKVTYHENIGADKVHDYSGPVKTFKVDGVEINLPKSG